ncbi:Nudix hydrolase 13, mitochondrial [Dichanthelium oligosanthes]|uniref:Nudix hydrolase 13, mitochondrial n=1 Tax=Dichanthelium oligosanthes TaxID=888268 RepID=A0A1E5WHQ0_9POAL|nr:Nudix hydrolase 13, mitochondrial [Dichanthelium oligosanthes]
MAPGEKKKILVARKGRLRQRYDGEYRLVAGCVPYRVGAGGHPELLMISTPNRDDLVFPKGGWEDDEDVHQAACREALEEAGVKGAISKTALGMWVFRSKSSPVSGDSPRGACKGYIFALEVAEELEQWPEQDTHGRQWVSPADAYRLCRYDWMREALSALLDRLAEAKPAAQELSDGHGGVYMMVKAAAATADRAVALC